MEMKQAMLKNGQTLNLRKAVLQDAEKLIAYCNLVGGESNFLTYGKNGCNRTVEQERRFLAELQNQPNSIYLMGFIKGELVCSANLCAEQTERLAHNCELGITVQKKLWGLGAASILMWELIDFAKNQSTLRAIHLGVYADNEPAIHLYRKFGFQTVGRFQDYFLVDGRYCDELLMDLYL